MPCAGSSGQHTAKVPVQRSEQPQLETNRRKWDLTGQALFPSCLFSKFYVTGVQQLLHGTNTASGTLRPPGSRQVHRRGRATQREAAVAVQSAIRTGS